MNILGRLEKMEHEEKKTQLAANIYIQICGNNISPTDLNLPRLAFKMAEDFMDEWEYQKRKNK